MNPKATTNSHITLYLLHARMSFGNPNNSTPYLHLNNQMPYFIQLAYVPLLATYFNMCHVSRINDDRALPVHLRQ